MDKEILSAMLDGESGADEIDKWMAESGDGAAAGELHRWGLIGQAMRGQACGASADFAARVRAGLAQDAAADGGDRVVALKPRSRRRWQPAVGWAAAASVAALAVLALRPDAGPATAPIPVETAELLVSPPQAVPAPVEAVPVRTARSATAPDARPRLNSYVMAYSNSRATRSFATPLGYARLAAYTGNEQR